MAKPTADWVRVADCFYRRTQIYTSVFEDDVELEDYHVVGAPFGGAVALYRDESKIHTYRGAQATKSTIDIYSCAGKLINQIHWERVNIAGVGWSEDERLIVVASDGTVRPYADLQSDFVPFNLGNGAEEHGVKSCRFWSTGFVALLGNNALVAVTRYDEPRPQLLASTPPGEVVSWAVIAPEHTSSRSVEVLLAIGGSVFVVDAAECEDRELQAGPFRHLGVSPSGKSVALYTDDGKVWVISSDFQERHSEYETKVKTPPRELQWCGNDAVVLAWEDEFHLIGPNGAAEKYEDYQSYIHILPDVDGVRIINNDVCEFVQRVPDASTDVYWPGSRSPAAVLVDATEQLERKSPKADDNIQLIRDSLDEAVDTCVKAAGHEFSVQRQKQLLKAASFGKSVLDLYNSDDFVEMTEALRVLNAVRYYEIGLPLSYEQYDRLTPERLVQRLINRREYLLALKVSEFLHLPIDKIYVHWARQKLRSSSTDDDSICAEIIRKLDGKRGISFEEVARSAFVEGRGDLAVRLLDHEPRASRQVPLLLNVGEESRALDKAIESGDTDLVFFVLLNLKKKMSPASFYRIINSRPVATAIVESSAIDQDQELLKDLYYQYDRLTDGANLLLSEALMSSDLNTAISKLKSAGPLLQDKKELALQANAMKEAQTLLRWQEGFEKEVGDRFVGLSVDATMGKLIDNGQMKRAQRVQTEFKVTDRTFSWVRLRALVRKRNFQELEELSRSKRSAIPWESYFNEILGAGNTKVASLFIPKCTNLTAAERIEMWLKVGMVTKAAEEAVKTKDVATLEELSSKAGAGDQVIITRMIEQLKKGR